MVLPARLVEIVLTVVRLYFLVFKAGLSAGPRQSEARLWAGGGHCGGGGGGQAFRSCTQQPRGTGCVSVQVLVGVGPLWGAEAHGGEVQSRQTAAWAGYDLLLVHRVSAVRPKGGHGPRVTGRGVIPVIVVQSSGWVWRRPGYRTSCNHVVVLQVSEGGQAGGPVGDGGPPAVR